MQISPRHPAVLAAALLAAACAAGAVSGCARARPVEAFPEPGSAPGDPGRPFAPIAGPGGDHWTERPPLGWRKLAVDERYFRYAVDRDGCRSGARCARIEGSELAERRAASLSQQFAAGGLAGRRVVVSAWIRQRDVREWAHLWVVARGTTNASLDAAREPTDPLLGDRDWRRVEAAIDVPAGAATVGLGFVLAGPGTMWIDDVRLTDAAGAPLDAPLANPDFEDEGAELR